LKICAYYELFYMPYKRWIDMIKRRIDSKVEKCFESEKSDVLTELTKFSSSSVEMCYCFSQAVLLWRLVDWPDYYGGKMFINELVECLSRACIRYATQIKENNTALLQHEQQQQMNNNSSPTSSMNNIHYQQPGRSSSSKQQQHGLLDTYQKLVITTNNLERVREIFKTFLTDIGYFKLVESVDRTKVTSGVDANTHYLETLISNTCDYIVQINEMTLDTIINNKIEADLEPHMFYLLESPESSPAHEVCSYIVFKPPKFVIFKHCMFKKIDNKCRQMFVLRCSLIINKC
jgi:hypothetical protein